MTPRTSPNVTEQGSLVTVRHPSGSSCEIDKLGATVTSWRVQDRERLFVSRKAVRDGTKPIRGGIPLVFPQFGQGPLMPGQHGFARKLYWTYTGVARDDPTEVLVAFELKDSDATRSSGWAHAFKLTYVVTLGADTLGTHLAVTNTDKTPFKFTPLLHTYFATPDITEVRVHDLKSLNYTDKVREAQAYYEDRDAVTFDAEVDRIYHGAPNIIHLDVDPRTTILIKKNNLRDVVVWNPWADKAQEMADFADEEYKSMFCVEAGTVHEAVSLQPSQTWEAGQQLIIK
ncbi:hypothetical protein IWQ60_007284 [Tieghemiomyces parasiticus]|uniref:Glucose-6-phosphate 1-epimerase n=1 Tax=Tieghemiomyces parasiticus TaxID=78921 RepID=A0A9W8A4Z7_9FUNG|nr:hypothetical protein IWQ60_007284 [Tieghemiomyces parasiticus]